MLAPRKLATCRQKGRAFPSAPRGLIVHQLLSTLVAMFIVPVFVDKSVIHGLGLYAARDIECDDVIWRFHPKLDLTFSPDEWQSLPEHIRDALAEHAWQPERGGLINYEATAGKYINHSDDPNTDFRTDGIGFAKCRILRGEELTTDYREFMWNHESVPFIGSFSIGGSPK